jgi:esterase/lipase superfamily enzyme
MEGFSMGGFGAAMYAAKHTALFSAVVEYGGALSKWQDLVNFNGSVASSMYNNVEANFIPYSLWDQTGLHANELRTSVDYKMIVGDADPQQNSNQRFRDYLLSLNIDPHYQVLPGVAHVGDDYFEEGSGLEFLDNHFASVPEPTAAATAACSIAILIAARRRSRNSHSDQQHA